MWLILCDYALVDCSANSPLPFSVYFGPNELPNRTTRFVQIVVYSLNSRQSFSYRRVFEWKWATLIRKTLIIMQHIFDKDRHISWHICRATTLADLSLLRCFFYPFSVCLAATNTMFMNIWLEWFFVCSCRPEIESQPSYASIFQQSALKDRWPLKSTIIVQK